MSLEFVYRELIVLETTSQLTDTQSEAIGPACQHCGSFLNCAHFLRLVPSAQYSLFKLDWLVDLELRCLLTSCLF